MSDITERLRSYSIGIVPLTIVEEAAGEIEQLRRDVKAADIKNDELRGRMAAAHALIEEKDLQLEELRAENLLLQRAQLEGSR